MEKQPLTIYQKLTRTFGFMGSKQTPPPSFEFDKEELLKTDSRTDFEKAKLQAQQTQYIADKWSKLDMSLYNQSVYYEPNRISAYYDYESMEFTPEVSAALDIYAEESCLVGSTKIPLLNGEEKTIKELFDDKYNNFWVYGVDIKNDSIKPSKVEKIISKGNKNVYKITLDDDTELICTDNHKWLTSDNKWVETKDLQFGSSLKSIYQKIDSKGYEKVSLKNSFYKFTHTIVGESELKSERETLLSDPRINKELIVLHHKSFNKRNNNPDQLEYMFWNNHQKLHTDLNKERWNNEEFSNKMKKIFSETAKKTWSEQRVEMSEKFSISIKKHMSTLTLEERGKKYGRKGKQNGMFGTCRNGIENPNYDVNKNHFEDIDENEYIKTIKTLSGNYKSILSEKYNLTNQSVIKFNHFLCWKYNLQRIEDVKFTNEGFSIEKIKNFIESEKYPKKRKGKYCKINNINYGDFKRFIKKRGYKDWSDIVDHLNNHRIVNIEYFGNEEVYDLFNSSVDSAFGVKCNNGMVISHNCTKSEKGQILSIHSDSKRIKHILDDLFYNVLDINTNIQMWTRGMCKYGDNFVYLKIDPEKGIIGCQQLPNIEVQRLEGARQSTPNQSDRVGSKFPSRELRFTWMNKDMEFQAWEIAHFRILGDDRKLPYGTSMLDKIRRIWKQLLLAEDAMLVYRTSRAPERRVFKVFVGNMDDKDIEPYVQRIANKFKRDQVVDQKNGQVDMRYNQMAVDQDYFIPVRDASQASPIETLPGAQNLGEIADIEYIQKKMLAALRIPKAFLGFEDVIGNGKGLALLDIRFARTINRIQMSVIQELNKIALIQLFLLGLEDELNNFTLMMTNPSGQSDLLKIEQWKEKITMYKDATSDQSQMGILPVSHTWAKKNILGFSDNEVILDLQQQRMERAIGFELTNTQMIIKRTGVFDDVDKKYGIPEEERKKLEASGATAQPGEAPGGGGGGGGGGSMPEMAGAPGGGLGEPPAPTGNEMGAPAGAAPATGAAPLSESRKDKILSMLNEDVTLENLFDGKKAQENIYQMEKAINEILNQ